jgi:hypothetical protein
MRMDQPELDRLVCERVTFVSTHMYPLARIPPYRIEALAYVDGQLKQVLLQMMAEMPGVLRERLVIDRQWPADWWQAVRARWFPRWWLRRWPVRYEQIQIDQPLYAAICPHLRTPDHGSHVQWLFAKQQELVEDEGG